MAVSPEATRAAQALDELYREHGADIYRYAYGILGHRADAEDLTQSTFMNALRAMERGERPRKPGNWLIAIAHNLARERFRRARARPTEVAFDGDTAAAGTTVDEDAVTVAELLPALGRIPPAQRSALVMREFEGRPYAEIARNLEITTSALETLLFRARRSLAEELENVVTCQRAGQEIGRLHDGSLGRKHRRRLEEHLRECTSCRQLHPVRPSPKRILRGLAWLPLPLPLKLFRNDHDVLTTMASRGSEAAAGTAGGTLAVGGGLGGLGGGLAVKAAAVAVATSVAGGIGYVGVDHVRSHPAPRTPAPKAGGESLLTRTGARVTPAAAAAQRAAPSRHIVDRRRSTPATKNGATRGRRGQTIARPAAAARRGPNRTSVAARKTTRATPHASKTPALDADKTTGKTTAPASAEQAKPTSSVEASGATTSTHRSTSDTAPTTSNGSADVGQASSNLANGKASATK